MKLSRVQFKKILKECIHELIEEGAFNSVIKENINTNSSGNQTRNLQAVNDLVSQQNPIQENPVQSFAQVGQGSPAERLKHIAKMTAMQTAKGDQRQANIMEQIFTDTAMTTLQQQLGNERSMSGNAGVYLGEQQDPTVDRADQMQIQALAGGLPKNYWASLAFGKAGKK